MLTISMPALSLHQQPRLTSPTLGGEPCNNCNSTGRCNHCRGTGKYVPWDPNCDRKCYSCNGTGVCGFCQGSGRRVGS
jgi:hypothetical protein